MKALEGSNERVRAVPADVLAAGAAEPAAGAARPARELAAFVHAVRVIQARSSRFALAGYTLYLILCLALLASAALIHNSVRLAERTLVYVATQPLHAPLLAAGLLIAVYLAIAAAVALARERDHGTLDVLLFGPVNEGAALLGIYAAYLRLYLVALLLTLGWVTAAALILNIALAPALLWVALSLALAASALIAFALLTACLGGRARTALAVFLVTTAVLATIQLSDQLVALAVASGYGSESLLVLSQWLERLAVVTNAVSPFALLVQGADYVAARQYTQFARTLAHLMLLSLLLLPLAAWLFRRKRGAL